MIEPSVHPKCPDFLNAWYINSICQRAHVLHCSATQTLSLSVPYLAPASYILIIYDTRNNKDLLAELCASHITAVAELVQFASLTRSCSLQWPAGEAQLHNVD
jgi:hypothetical protein